MSADLKSSGLRTWIEGLSPYRSLAILALPVCLIEPMKFVAVAIAGEGYWLTGTLTISAAYAGSLFLVERLFIVVKPKLLKLRWFAKLWVRIIGERANYPEPNEKPSIDFVPALKTYE
jgi:hypothetical protein